MRSIHSGRADPIFFILSFEIIYPEQNGGGHVENVYPASCAFFVCDWAKGQYYEWAGVPRVGSELRKSCRQVTLRCAILIWLVQIVE